MPVGQKMNQHVKTFITKDGRAQLEVALEQERGVEFEQAVNLLSRTLVNQQLVSYEGAAVEQLINENTLVALALLVAESLSDQKELMIRLAEHFIFGLKLLVLH